MYEPEVSIITPTFNIIDEGHTDDFNLLVNLLDRQTYPYIEHIIMDNASSDDTINYLKDYKNAGYLNFYTDSDLGKYDAINKGLLRAKGKYVGFLSCDDFYHDITAIAEIVYAMEEEEADYCYFKAYCSQQDGSVFQYEPSFYNVFQVMPCSHQAMFFKKSALEELGFFDSKFKLLADYDLVLRLVINGFRGVMIDKNFVTYKLGEQIMKYPTQVEAECSHIFYKNYKHLYPINDEILDRMVKLSEIPQPLLEKFTQAFPGEEELFYERYEQMYNMRLQNMQMIREQQRRNR